MADHHPTERLARLSLCLTALLVMATLTPAAAAACNGCWGVSVAVLEEPCIAVYGGGPIMGEFCDEFILVGVDWPGAAPPVGVVDVAVHPDAALTIIKGLPRPPSVSMLDQEDCPPGTYLAGIVFLAPNGPHQAICVGY